MAELKINDFDSIAVKLASPDQILGWSHGEILRPETINYRTQRPEKDGLFCEKIFGPTKDWECYCGKYKKIRYKGIVCDKCGVEVTRAIVRRERMGHITLATPVSHIWFLRGVPSKVGLILDISVQKLEKVIYFANFIIMDVDQQAKDEEIENLKKEFITQQKTLDNQLKQKVSAVTNNNSIPNADKTAAIVKLNQEIEQEKTDLEKRYQEEDKTLKRLRPLELLAETTFQDLSLKYGHVFEAGIGAAAVRKLLEKVDVEQEVKIMEKHIKNDNVGGEKKIVNRLKLLRNLKRNKIRPEWMILSVVPVIPPDLRPMVPLDGGRYATSDLNDLYRRVLSRNNRLKKLLELNAPEVICRNERRMLQEAVDALIDNSARHTKAVAATMQKRPLKSLADYLKGKQGRFRQNLLGKRTDYSGRSVIVVGPHLKLHQCGLPKTMAIELFKPFIISRLIRDGFVHNIRSANRFIELDRPEVWDILEDVVKDSHVLLNRAPTLHRLGIQAFQPILVEGKAIQLHPLVCTAFNADFDGDQMAVHLPLTEEAKLEAKELMRSTKNLLKPATGQSIVTPSKDMIWGIYYVTSVKDENAEPKKYFASIQEAKIAYDLRKITLRDIIAVRVIDEELKKKCKDEKYLKTTLGRIIFNKILPEKLAFYNAVIEKKRFAEIIQGLFEHYDFETVAVVLDDIKDFGFKQLTKSGFSWGMSDLPVIKEKQPLIEEGNRLVDEIENQYEDGLLTADERYTKIIETWTVIKDKIAAVSKQYLDTQGPVYSMIDSGARGSWAQLIQMLGMKGLVINPAGQIIELPVKANFKEGFNVLEYYISTHGTRKGLTDTALRTANSGYLTRRLVDVAQEVMVLKDDCGDIDGFLVTRKDAESCGQKFFERIVGRYTVRDIILPKTRKPLVKAGEMIVADFAKKIDKELGVEDVLIRSALSCKLKKGICQKCYGIDLAYNKLVEIGTAVGVIAAQSIGEPGTQLTMRTFHTGGVAGVDITQGLPRVEEIFEVRPPKKKALMSEVEGNVDIQEVPRVIQGTKGEIVARTSFGEKILKIRFIDKEKEAFQMPESAKLKVKVGESVLPGTVIFVTADKHKIKNKQTGIVQIDGNKIEISGERDAEKEYLIPAGTVLWVKNGDYVYAGDQLTEGSLDLQQLYKLKSKEAVQKYILKEIQSIYTSQGQKLNEKHIEIIIKQLFSRVYVKNAGDTELLEGEIVCKSEFLDANDRVGKGALAEGEDVLLGITRVALTTGSFLAAASFQETARVLINAALSAKADGLEGLKENVIIGRLIPAGTGFHKHGISDREVEEPVEEKAAPEV
ncbi:MAG: DNA-directed RNA polymerase subunit beta' [Candidatus Falkowbacteria bacterium]